MKVRFRSLLRSFFVALDAEKLTFRRSPHARIKKTILLSRLKSITAAEACKALILAGRREVELVIEPEEHCKAWVAAIKESSATSTHISETQQFRTVLQRLRDVLSEREAQTLQDCQDAFARVKNAVQVEIEALEKEEKRIPKLFPEKSLAEPTLFQKLSAASAFLMKPLIADLQVTPVQVFLNSSCIQSLLDSGVTIHSIDPEEYIVQRSSSTAALKWKYTGEHFDAISFRVDKSVRLTAISVCTPTRPRTAAVVEDFKILNGITSHSPEFYCHEGRVVLGYRGASTQKIPLRSEIDVKAGEFYTVLLRIKGKSTYKCVNCLNSISSSIGVHWDFRSTVFVNPRLSNKSDATSGPIAGVFFRRLE